MAKGNDSSKEGRIQLALEAYKNGQFTSITKTAAAFDVPLSTLKTRVKGTSAWNDSTSNSRKFSITEESTLRAWILDLDKRGLPPYFAIVRYLAQLLLSALLNKPVTFGKKWVTRFVRRHKELRAKYS
jgi:hypothetical protein